jgi:hypothetical protein
MQAPILAFLNKKKSAGTRLGEYGRCMSRRRLWASHQLETTASMSRGELSQSENHCWDISSLFSCKFYTPWAAGRDLLSIRRSLATAATTEEMILAVRMVFLRLRWHAPCLLNNSVSLQRTQVPVPMGSFHCFFLISVKLFPALARSATKSCTLVIHGLGGGSARLAPSRSRGAQLNFWRKPV